MSRKFYILFGFITAVLCATAIFMMGKTYKVRTNIRVDEHPDYSVLTDQGDSVIRVTDQQTENGCLTLMITSTAQGMDYLSVMDGNENLRG